jgi:hypothetical protein
VKEADAMTDSNPKLCECGCNDLAPIATYTSRHWGWVKGEPKRFRQGHQARLRGKEEWSDVFWSDEDRGHDTPCHIWLKSTDNLGYGRFRGNVLAHRFAWERINGAIPTGLDLDHLCRVPSCVNPSHLEPVTHHENLLRGKGTKINFQIAGQMREMYGGGRGKGMTQAEIAAHFGVEKRTVWLVTSGRSWTHDPTIRA